MRNSLVRSIVGAVRSAGGQADERPRWVDVAYDLEYKLSTHDIRWTVVKLSALLLEQPAKRVAANGPTGALAQSPTGVPPDRRDRKAFLTGQSPSRHQQSHH